MKEENVIVEKSYAFALRVMDMCKVIRDKREYDLACCDFWLILSQFLNNEGFYRRKQRERRSFAHYILKSPCFVCLPMPGLKSPPIDPLRLLLFKKI